MVPLLAERAFYWPPVPGLLYAAPELRWPALPWKYCDWCPVAMAPWALLPICCEPGFWAGFSPTNCCICCFDLFDSACFIGSKNSEQPSSLMVRKFEIIINNLKVGINTEAFTF